MHVASAIIDFIVHADRIDPSRLQHVVGNGALIHRGFFSRSGQDSQKLKATMFTTVRIRWVEDERSY